MTKELAEKKCYELIHRALRIAREYDPEIHRISCFIIDDGPEASIYTNVRAMKKGEGVDEDGFDNLINVLEYSKFEYSEFAFVTTGDKGEQA